jgi:hypothetical protein
LLFLSQEGDFSSWDDSHHLRDEKTTMMISGGQGRRAETCHRMLIDAEQRDKNETANNPTDKR